jgi:dihydrodipicolinate synthase/N-acetylneuraminate lyase
MKILLDIDDTALIYNKKNKEYVEHKRLRELLLKHDVVLYSGNPDIELYYNKWGAKGFVPKEANYIPNADVLIDNNADLHIHDVNVKKSYRSIDLFFRFNKK